MKKNLIILSLILTIFIFLNEKLTAQDWHVAGNNLVGGEKLGSLNNFDLRIFTDNIQRIRVRGTTGNGFVGIGNNFSSPDNTLHVFKGSAGIVAAHVNAPLVVENSTHCYLNLLAPNANETGILFGKPASNVSGGIIFNNPGLPNGLQFRIFNNSTRMQLTNEGVLQLLGGTDVNAANGGFLIAGSLSGLNIGIDNNEIMARNNGAATTLFLNHEGGDVLIDDLFSGAHMGIGTASPSPFKLKVSHGAFGFNIENHANGNDWEQVILASNLSLYFNGAFRGSFSSTNGVYSAVSDERLKSNIQGMSAVLPKIDQLKPVTYQFKNTNDQNVYGGFIAQEVQKVFPSLVTHNVNPERSLDIYSLDYSGFGVIAIKGIQELQQTIQEQQQKITTLEDRIAKLEAALNLVNSNSINGKGIIGASLEQNQPNPFNQTTIIRYKIPQGANAQIMIYDAKGSLVKSLRATESGQAQVNASELSAGSYTYTLMINGKSAGSKKMVLTR